MKRYFASTLKTPDFCLVMKECKIKNKFLSKEDSKGGYSFGLKAAKQTLELLRSRRLMSAECHYYNTEFGHKKGAFICRINDSAGT